MKAIKFFTVAMAMAFAMNASAQFTQPSSSKKTGKSSSTSFEPEKHFTLDLKVGGVGGAGGFGVGIGYQKSIYQYRNWTLAWDVVNAEWSAPFSSPADLDILSAKTGLRLFTPSFCNDKLRLYTNLSMGYTCVLSKGGSLSINGKDEIMEAFSNYFYSDGYMEDYYEDAFFSICEKYGYSEAYIESVLDGNYMEDQFENGNYDDAWNYLSSAITGASSKMSASHGFGLNFGVGLQIKKKISIGYTLQYETAFKSKSHFATIGFSF